MVSNWFTWHKIFYAREEEKNTNNNIIDTTKNGRKKERKRVSGKNRQKHMTATAINSVITKFYNIIGTMLNSNPRSNPRNKDTCMSVFFSMRPQKSRYTTRNHNIMVIFFEFNLNILNFSVFDYYLHWALST